MRVGIIGYGLAGRIFHGRLLKAAGADVVAVVTRNPQRRAEVAADFPSAACRDDVAAMLAHDRLGLAVVASPTAAHAEAAAECVRAGVPVVVDKPFATTAAQARDVLDQARAAGVPLTVFQNRRWDSDFLTLKRTIADGGLGHVIRFESRFERWRPEVAPGKWREELGPDQGGGTLLDLGSHLVDQAVQLFGPVRSVYAEIAARRGLAADDEVFLSLRHADVHSHLSCGAIMGSPGPRMRVLGTKGAFVVEDLDGQEDALREGLSADQARPAIARVLADPSMTPVPPVAGNWAGYYPAVLAALRGEGPLPVDPADVVHVMEVLDAAREAGATGEIVHL
ncbi:Gfo/Idh/MocA family protein [Hamadaea tsunoensis]|uniref:Gfo/Idh/MocA family protein n=1 Tax=Hamadaea tsunoensis TaxID=53368 RepID=UPI000410016C|nr:Gfo/Idh/MocA family oxidoreductase [Hamadaea tsunoensis]